MTHRSKGNGNRRHFLKCIGGSVIAAPFFTVAACSKREPDAPPASQPTATPPADTTPTPTVAAAPAPAAAPVEATAAASTTPATGNLPHLDESNPVAKALGYHQDAGTVDATKYPQHVAGQACHKCVQFRGAATDAWGPCNIFSANLVNANGWCTAFAAKT